MDTALLIVLAGAAAAGFAQGALSVWAWTVEPQLAAPMAVFGSGVALVWGSATVWISV